MEELYSDTNGQLSNVLNGQLKDILLVVDKKDDSISVVSGIDENGELKKTKPNRKDSNQFMKIDRNGDVFSNFFSNFLSQLKNPTRFYFFRIASGKLNESLNRIKRQLSDPTGRPQLLKQALTNQGEKNQTQSSTLKNTTMETVSTTNAAEVKENRFKTEQINWESLSALGITREKLEKQKVLDSLLKGYKSDYLVPLTFKVDESSVIRMDARLSLQADENGKVILNIHGVHKEPQLHFPFFGHEFTEEDKKNLLTTGNMGRVVNLTNPKNGETIPSIISIDRLTNDIVALRTEWIKIPDEIKGVKLNDEQKQILKDGKPLHLKGMISTKGEPFDTNVQFNADKRRIEFLFNNNLNQKNIQSQNQQNQTRQEIPKTLRGRDLTDEQYSQLKDGQTIYLSGLIDKNERPYQGYFTLNKESGKVDFSFKNPNDLKNKVKPDETHKTQVAVNSEGKTNEATKDLKEPLNKGQQQPNATQKEQKEKKEQVKQPAKAKGVKR